MIAQYSGPDRKLEYLFQHAKEVSLSPILTTGTPLATLTIDGQSYTLYCTTGGGGGGSTVSYNSLITSGTALGELTIDGIKYTIYSKDSSKVAYSATQTSGTQIGTLTIDGTPYILYAPKQEELYSNTEQVVGTWIDGRPVYQITIGTPSTYVSTQSLTSLNIDYVISIDGLMGDSANGLTSCSWITQISTAMYIAASYMTYDKSNNRLNISSSHGYCYCVTIKYVKNST